MMGAQLSASGLGLANDRDLKTVGLNMGSGAGLPSLDLQGRILVVEDDYFVGLSIEDALVEAGHEVLAVIRTGEEAIEAAQELEPDLALMDIRLAGLMDGVDAALALRRQGIPSLFASAHSDEGMRTRGAAAQPVGWITKPFSSRQLVDAIHAALVRLRGRAD